MFAVRDGDKVLALDWRMNQVWLFNLRRSADLDSLREKVGKHVADLVISAPNQVVNVSKCEFTELVLC